MRNYVKYGLLVLVAFFANSMLASSEARTPVNERHHCGSINDANYCKATAGCDWNDVYDICHDVTGEVSARHGCWRYETRWRCLEAGCSWDHGRCYSGGGGGGGGGGGYGCRSIYSRWECNNTHGCRWSWREDRCVRN